MLSFLKKKTKKKFERKDLDFSFEIFDKEIESKIKDWIGSSQEYLKIFASVLRSLGLPVKQVQLLKYNKDQNCFTLLDHDSWTIYLRYGNWDFLDEIWIEKGSVITRYDFIFRKDTYQLIYRGITDTNFGVTVNSSFLSHYAAFSKKNLTDIISIVINLDFNFSSPLSKNQKALEDIISVTSSDTPVKEILWNVLALLDIPNEHIEKIDKIEVKRSLLDKKNKEEGFTTHSIMYNKGLITQFTHTCGDATTIFSCDENWTYIEKDFSISNLNHVYYYKGTVDNNTNINLLIVKAESSVMHTQTLVKDIQYHINRK